MPTTPRGYPLLTADQKYALVTDYNKLAVKADAEATVTEARAQEVANAAKVFAQQAADEAEATANRALGLVEPVRGIADEALAKATNAETTAEEAKALAVSTTAPTADAVAAVLGDPDTSAGAVFATRSAKGALMVDSADHPDLPSALAAARPGQTVIVRAGDHRLSERLTIPAGVHVHLEDGATIAPSTEMPNLILLTSGSSVEGGRIHSRGLITSRFINCENASKVELKGVKIDDTTDDGTPAFRAVMMLRINNVKGLLVEGCDFTGGAQGVFVQDANEDITVRRVTVRKWTDRAIFARGSYTIGATKNILIEDCLVEDVAQGGTVRYPIRLESTWDPNDITRRILHDGVVVRRCRVVGNYASHKGTAQADGSTLYGTADQISVTQARNVTIEDCVSNGGGDCGFVASGCEQVRITNCYAHAPGTAGLAMGAISGVGGVTDTEVTGLTVVNPSRFISSNVTMHNAAVACRVLFSKRVRVQATLVTSSPDEVGGVHAAGVVYADDTTDVRFNVTLDGTVKDKPVRVGAGVSRIVSNVIETLSVDMTTAFIATTGLHVTAYRQSGFVTVTGSYSAAPTTIPGATLASLPLGWRPPGTVATPATRRTEVGAHVVRVRSDGVLVVYWPTGTATGGWEFSVTYPAVPA